MYVVVGGVLGCFGIEVIVGWWVVGDEKLLVCRIPQRAQSSRLQKSKSRTRSRSKPAATTSDPALSAASLRT